MNKLIQITKIALLTIILAEKVRKAIENRFTNNTISQPNSIYINGKSIEKILKGH